MSTHYHAGSNGPGYLPDSPASCFPTYAEAKSWMLEELNLDADNVSSWADPHDCDDIPCPAYGDDCPASKGDSLSAAAEELNLDNGPEWAEVVAGRAYWITAVGNDDCDEFEREHVAAHATSEADRTVWQLAGLAGCLSPDTLNSPGAAWLVRVAHDAEELAEDQGDNLSDSIHERADSAVPIYTHEIWSVFVDLGAYQEDISDHVHAETDMEKLAQVALYVIAERLLSALLEAA